jgi:signal transduction histidine kinase
MRTSLVRRVAWSLPVVTGVLATVAVLASLRRGGVPIVDRNSAPTPFLLVALTVALVFAGVGALVAARRPRNPVGWSLAALGVGLASLFTVKAWADLTLVVVPGLWPDPTLGAWLTGWLFAPVSLLAPTLVLLFFPDGALPSPRWRAVLWAAVGAAVVLALAVALRPGEIERSDFPGLLNPVGLRGPAGSVASALVAVSTVVATGALVLAVASQVVRYRSAAVRERQQIKWIAYPAAMNLLLWSTAELFDDALGTALWVAGFVALAALPVGAGVAILRHRLYDIDLIISRTLVYGVLTACVIGVYVVVVGYLGALFRADGTLPVSLVATGVVAVMFAPLRERVQRAVNRLVFGQREDPYAVLSRLGRNLETALAPEAALQAVADTVAQALRLPYAAVRVRQPDGREATVAESGRAVGTPLPMPLIHHRAPVGTLALCPRRGETGFAAADRPLLDDLARQAAAVVHAMQLTVELQRSRERLVAGREEERRRLRRDLHDGIGPQLAAQNLKIGSARAVYADRPELTADLLAELEDDAERALADLRRVVDDLRPPALDELGLDGAVAEAARRYGASGVQFAVRAPSLPPLPAAVEVAAYRIVTEALTNVVRHAGATRCEVCVRLDGALHLEVVDDGVGLPADRRAGVGLASMSERAAELGGSCEIESVPGAGTRVRATLPVPQEVAHG